jgi:hypothetical protein
MTLWATVICRIESGRLINRVERQDELKWILNEAVVAYFSRTVTELEENH